MGIKFHKQKPKTLTRWKFYNLVYFNRDMWILFFKIWRFWGHIGIYLENIMGGEREVVVEKKASSKSSTDLGGLRIHESQGEVHFHDDKSKLKAAVPVATWWRAWDKLRSEPGIWHYIDSKLNSQLTVETKIEKSVFEVVVSLNAASAGPNYDKLNDFTRKK
jgi:hypothetical protein